MQQMIDQLFILPLPIWAKGPTEEEDIGQKCVALGFVVQRSLIVRRERSFTRQEQSAILLREKIIEFGAKPQIERRKWSELAYVHRE